MAHYHISSKIKCLTSKEFISWLAGVNTVKYFQKVCFPPIIVAFLVRSSQVYNGSCVVTFIATILTLYQYFLDKNKILGGKVKKRYWKKILVNTNRGQNRTEYTIDPGIYFLMKINKLEFMITSTKNSLTTLISKLIPYLEGVKSKMLSINFSVVLLSCII